MATKYDIPDINSRIELYNSGDSYNTKIKVYPDGSTIKVHCSDYIFRYKDPLKDFKEIVAEPDVSDSGLFDDVLLGFEEIKSQEELEFEYLSGVSIDPVSGEVLRKKTDFFDSINASLGEQVTDKEYNEFLVYRAQKRAKDRIFDICMCNDWQWFFTGTFDDKKVGENTPRNLIKKLNNWLAKMVLRKRMKYVLVAEYTPKNHRIHFHGLLSGDIEVVDSGTVLMPVKKARPVKLSTAIQRGYSLDKCKRVFDLRAWSDRFGFTTCIPVTGERINLSRYITKYITKDNDKIFGKYYFSSRNIVREPETIYVNELFDDVFAPSFSCVGVNGFLKYEMDFPKK